MRQDRKVQSMNIVRSLQCIKLLPMMTFFFIIVIFFFALYNAWLTQKYFWKSDHHISVESHIPTGMWWWVLHFYKWPDSKSSILPENLEQLAFELLSILSWGSFVGTPLTAGDSLFRCQKLDKMPSWIWVLRVFGNVDPRAAESFPTNFCPSLCLFIEHDWLCKTAAELEDTDWRVLLLS